MSSPTPKMPLQHAARMLLTEGQPRIRAQARQAIRRHLKGKQDEYFAVVAALDAMQGGPCLPFQLEADEMLVAHAMAVECRSHDVAIFSNLSRVDTGAVIISKRGVAKYLDHASVELNSSSWLYPFGRAQYLGAVEKLTADGRLATMDLDEQLVFEIPVSRATLAAVNTSYRWTVRLLDSDFEGPKSMVVAGCKVEPQQAQCALRVTISLPESILRISAAAALRRWICVSEGDLFCAYVHLRPLESRNNELGVIASAIDVDWQLLHMESDAAVDVPLTLWKAAWPSAKCHAANLTPAVMRCWDKTGVLPP